MDIYRASFSKTVHTYFGNRPKSFLNLEIGDGTLRKSAKMRQKAPMRVVIRGEHRTLSETP